MLQPKTMEPMEPTKEPLMTPKTLVYKACTYSYIKQQLAANQLSKILSINSFLTFIKKT